MAITRPPEMKANERVSVGSAPPMPLPSTVSCPLLDASALYARNLLDFLKLIITKEGELKVDLEDDIVAACLMTQGGEVKKK